MQIDFFLQKIKRQKSDRICYLKMQKSGEIVICVNGVWWMCLSFDWKKNQPSKITIISAGSRAI